VQVKPSLIRHLMAELGYNSSEQKSGFDQDVKVSL